jgi:hypothetical protein
VLICFPRSVHHWKRLGGHPCQQGPAGLAARGDGGGIDFPATEGLVSEMLECRSDGSPSSIGDTRGSGPSIRHRASRIAVVSSIALQGPILAPFIIKTTTEDSKVMQSIAQPRINMLKLLQQSIPDCAKLFVGDLKYETGSRQRAKLVEQAIQAQEQEARDDASGLWVSTFISVADGRNPLSRLTGANRLPPYWKPGDEVIRPLQASTQKYTIGQFLGAGTYGQVFGFVKLLLLRCVPLSFNSRIPSMSPLWPLDSWV